MLRFIRKYRWVAFAFVVSAVTILNIGFHWGSWALLAAIATHFAGFYSALESSRVAEIEEHEARMQFQEDLEQLDDAWYTDTRGDQKP